MSVKAKNILLTWCWWNARNKINAGERPKLAQQIISDVLFHLQAWRNVSRTEIQAPLSACKPKWRPPPEDVYKITFRVHKNLSGCGFVIRNHSGEAVAAGASSADFLMSAQHAEQLKSFNAPLGV
uniref:RNase H type-1 domain-containing protein n=1 Tax=Setaria viridis TaxID=4556 RepID=A0A4U6VVC8_SETVI|nr:hypothetical protein SEVIR_3G353050v2 [Setaria viridis]